MSTSQRNSLLTQWIETWHTKSPHDSNVAIQDIGWWPYNRWGRQPAYASLLGSAQWLIAIAFSDSMISRQHTQNAQGSKPVTSQIGYSMSGQTQICISYPCLKHIIKPYPPLLAAINPPYSLMERWKDVLLSSFGPAAKTTWNHCVTSTVMKQFDVISTIVGCCWQESFLPVKDAGLVWHLTPLMAMF